MMRLDFRVFLPLVAALLGGLAVATVTLAEDLRTPEQRIGGLERQMGDAAARLQRIQTAQLFNRPPADIPDDSDSPDGSRPILPVQDAAGLDVRVDRLESQMRNLNGQIEQTQFEIRRLGDELKKFREDIDFRLQDQSARPAPHPAPQKRADAGDLAGPADYPPAAVIPAPGPPAPAVVATARPPRGDAFDPDANPDAPGAPRTLGSLPSRAVASPDAPIAVEPDAAQPDGDMPEPGPLDLSNGANPRPAAPRPAPLPGPAVVASTGVPGPAALSPGAPGVAPPLGGTARDEFDQALAQYKQGQYETAQTSLDAFIQKFPKDRLVADAVYYLGETYSQRGRYREAAEQYLKVATDYSKSSRAPEGLVRLGVSLNALGAKEQACATFGEVARKYPNASVAVKNSVDREIKRAKC